MSLIYGERWSAFRRLQEEILKVPTDDSIFAWRLHGPPPNSFAGLSRDKSTDHKCGLKAPSPDCFLHSSSIIYELDLHIPRRSVVLSLLTFGVSTHSQATVHAIGMGNTARITMWEQGFLKLSSRDAEEFVHFIELESYFSGSNGDSPEKKKRHVQLLLHSTAVPNGGDISAIRLEPFMLKTGDQAKFDLLHSKWIRFLLRDLQYQGRLRTFSLTPVWHEMPEQSMQAGDQSNRAALKDQINVQIAEARRRRYAISNRFQSRPPVIALTL